MDTFTLYGESTEPIYYDNTKTPILATKNNSNSSVNGYQTKSVPAFTLQKQLGLANKFEFYKNDQWSFTTGQTYYRNRLSDKGSYAFDFGANLDGTIWEYWLDAMYGFTAKAPFDSYATYRKTEYFVQTGAQYHLDETWSFLTNVEYLHVKDLAFTFPSSFVVNGTTYAVDSSINRYGQLAYSTSYKIELGVQYQLSKSSFITNGVLYEKKIVDKVAGGSKAGDPASTIYGIKNPNTEGYQFLSTVSFWF
jgi:hypothetical protein